jgi:Mn-dependent DtxR family transcriptional regulator
MRRADQKRLEAIWQTVEQKPGIKAGRVAREMELSRSAVMRALPALEEAGLLLSEDDHGCLWPWAHGDGRGV